MSKFDDLKMLVSSKTARQVLVAQKHSPRILFAAGVVGVVGATVLACRATLKLTQVLDDHDVLVDKERALHEKVDGTAYSDELLKKNLVKLNMKLAIDITRLYAPAVGVGILGVASLTGSHIVLTKRNTATMAAYAAVDKAYKDYRGRIIEKFGAETDRDISQGVEERKVEEKLADGTTATTTEKVVKGPHIGGSGYAQVFDERSGKFTKMPGMNAQIVMMCQNYANDKLRSQGHLFLNEVWDMLQLPRTQAGSVVGWVYDDKNAAHTGDNYVTFNVFDGDSEEVEKFIEGKEKYVTLDPNVDGVIWDKI